jgi:hypothetical protein
MMTAYSGMLKQQMSAFLQKEIDKIAAETMKEFARIEKQQKLTNKLTAKGLPPDEAQAISEKLLP